MPAILARVADDRESTYYLNESKLDLHGRVKKAEEKYGKYVNDVLSETEKEAMEKRYHKVRADIARMRDEVVRYKNFLTEDR